MAETKKLKMLEKLATLKSIIENPNYYLAKYFQELRDNVDIDMASKQIFHNNDNKMKNELDLIWIEIISKIYSFEKQCKNEDELESNLNRIDKIGKMLENQMIANIKLPTFAYEYEPNYV